MSYFVVGNPVTHSISPEMHQAFAKQLGEEIRYGRHTVPVGRFAAEVEGLQAKGCQGLSVTLPCKGEAFAFADALSSRALMAEAVNVLALQSGCWFGDNFDGVGLVTALTKHHQQQLESKRILLIGAGGAVRGALLPLLEARPACLYLCNRTQAKAESLAEKFSEFGNIKVLPWGNKENEFDLIINGSSWGLQSEPVQFPEVWLAQQPFCYDMIYHATLTPFLQWVSAHGGQSYADGLSMLVEQGALSYQLWRGCLPETASVYAALSAKKR